MPINKKYPLPDLLEVVNSYFPDPRRKVTIEYVMLAGINESVQHAKQLVKILSKGRYKINLIVFNPVSGVSYQPTKLAAIEKFREVLLAAGFNTITRKTRGADIAAACGQLRGMSDIISGGA
jgi:23S rRNA (adenine2503-C2)-methyltransferase